jgi:type IV secretion system protein VirD4
MSGSVSRSKNDPSESLQMMERPLLTPDELKSLPKGDFVVMKPGVHPMRVHLKLFFKWGIEFDKDHPYTVPRTETQGARRNKGGSMDGIVKMYIPKPCSKATLQVKAVRWQNPSRQRQRTINLPKAIGTEADSRNLFPSKQIKMARKAVPSHQRSK